MRHLEYCEKNISQSGFECPRSGITEAVVKKSDKRAAEKKREGKVYHGI